MGSNVLTRKGTPTIGGWRRPLQVGDGGRNSRVVVNCMALIGAPGATLIL